MEPNSIVKGKRVAIIHDWLITIGGAEKVLGQLLELYPNADVFCLLDYFKKDQRNQVLLGKKTKSSYLQKLPFAKKYYRMMIPFFYRAIERLDVSKYDIIISSSHAVAKGVKKKAGQLHVCYCHTPVRYVWNMRKTYLAQVPDRVRGIAMLQLKRMKKWDLKVADQVDHFIANSRFIADRIKQNYNKESTVIYPPVDTDFYQQPTAADERPIASPYFLVVSRLVHYKRIDLIIEAFNAMPDKKLVIIGTGPQEELLHQMARDNVSFLGYCDPNCVRQYMQFAEAMILAAIEDFGITSLEVQACGVPVIAFNYGGYQETVIPNQTGVMFDVQNEASIREGVAKFLALRSTLAPDAPRNNALTFKNARFKSEISSFIEEKLNQA